MRVKATITLDFIAPDSADAWDLVRTVTTTSAHRLTQSECREVNPDIVSVTADGRKVTFKPKPRRG